jgi:hypothetical protein
VYPSHSLRYLVLLIHVPPRGPGHDLKATVTPENVLAGASLKKRPGPVTDLTALRDPKSSTLRRTGRPLFLRPLRERQEIRGALPVVRP